MKKFSPLLALLLGLTFISCDPNLTAAGAEGILINGIVWAPSNTAITGGFYNSQHFSNIWYQWNNGLKWMRLDETDPITPSTWNTVMPSGTWNDANDMCPTGWRTPTKAELETLLDATKVQCTSHTMNGVPGARFIDLTGSRAMLFLPISGCLNLNTGVLETTDSGYWSSTPVPGTQEAWALDIGRYGGLVMMQQSRFTWGFSLRCVKK